MSGYRCSLYCACMNKLLLHVPGYPIAIMNCEDNILTVSLLMCIKLVIFHWVFVEDESTP